MAIERIDAFRFELAIPAMVTIVAVLSASSGCDLVALPPNVEQAVAR